MAPTSSHDSVESNSIVSGSNISVSSARSTNAGIFAQVLDRGEVLADDGQLYSSVQTAENNATGAIWIGPGTFNEAVTINTADFNIVGSGGGTVIDGGEGNGIGSSSNNLTIKSLSVRTDGSTTEYRGMTFGGNNITVSECTSLNSSSDGIGLFGSDSMATGCVVEVAGDGNSGTHNCIESGGSRNILKSNFTDDSSSGRGHYFLSDDSILSNCISVNGNNQGIRINQEDNIIIGNRVINAVDWAIVIASSGAVDNIVANNRFSDSGINDLEDNGTGTVLDANLTGVSN